MASRKHINDFILVGLLEPQNVTSVKAHMRELIAQLATAEEDKEKIAQEAYLKAMDIKNEADKRLDDARACQTKQASLIERLTAKVTDYKNQCKIMEDRLAEVNELANQSQAQLGDTSEAIGTLEGKLKVTEVCMCM